ncbi:MAG: deoxyribodipyrimidine photo-lyase [Rickettsiales bacterium]
MSKKLPIAIFWFRRDLRLEDNAGLLDALKSGFKILPIFIFDQDILKKLGNKKDPRVLFIYRQIENLKKQLEKIGSSLLVLNGIPSEVFENLSQEYQLEAVFANRDYEPYARKRDLKIYEFLKLHNIDFKGFKDHVIFEKNEITKDDGKPYLVFTPYKNKWKKSLNELSFQPYECDINNNNFVKCQSFNLPEISQIGFEDFDFPFFPQSNFDLNLIEKYEKNRDFPAITGTSHLGIHLRFGTISIRKACEIASKISEKWLDELIWREFYQMIIFHFPHSATRSFKEKFDRIIWRNDEGEFQKWCDGKTGYPIVDAGMRELNATGFMHNRVRMVVASFLSKHLLIDWRWGEKYFATKLLDYELSSNVGGWQWVVGSGCDGAPYFRIFNPEMQAKKFDSDEKYIKKWIGEFGTKDYPLPMIDHKAARNRCLEVFSEALNQKN